MVFTQFQLGSSSQPTEGLRLLLCELSLHMCSAMGFMQIHRVIEHFSLQLLLRIVLKAKRSAVIDAVFRAVRPIGVSVPRTGGMCDTFLYCCTVCAFKAA